MHLIVFSTILTPRIKYIFNFIFKDILKAEVEFTGNSQYFLESEQAKISYGEQPMADELFFKSSKLLFSNKLEEINIKTISFGDYQAPFPVENSLLPFDVFAASFFILSRYEEYIHQQKTQEDFKPTKSNQHKWKILDRPIIDEWALILRNLVRTKYPQFKFNEQRFSQQPTLNFEISPTIPEGFIKRTKFLFSAAFDKENNYLSSTFDRITGIGIKTDQVLNEMEKIFEKAKITPVYFIGFPNVIQEYLTINGASKYLNTKSVGLLRPCASNKQKASFIKEGLSKLKKLLPEQVNMTSQQLEILKFPICYLNLLNTAITSDYSMGYAETPGFRAGTCTPFSWYDLQLEKVTPLNVKSYCISDSALQYLSEEEIKAIINSYIDAVKVVNGSFISSWQLRNISNQLKYKKLSSAFKEMLNYAHI